MKNKIVLLTLIFLSLSTIMYSQGTKKIGISGTLQDNQFGILIPIWLGEKIAIAPSFYVNIAEKVGADFGFAIAPRFYLKNGKIAPYFGAKVGTLINKPSSDNKVDTETKIDWLGGLAFGGEYYISENFCFGVEIQANLTKSDENSERFGNPDGVNFNTGTMISATLYF